MPMKSLVMTIGKIAVGKSCRRQKKDTTICRATRRSYQPQKKNLQNSTFYYKLLWEETAQTCRSNAPIQKCMRACSAPKGTTQARGAGGPRAQGEVDPLKNIPFRGEACQDTPSDYLVHGS